MTQAFAHSLAEMERDMKGFKWKDMGRTRGGRIGRRGAVLFYLGFAGIFIGGWTAAQLRAPDLVIGAVLVVTFGMAFGGLVLTVVGRRTIDRDQAEYHRKVESGEIPPWKPGDPNPLA